MPKKIRFEPIDWHLRGLTLSIIIVAIILGVVMLFHYVLLMPGLATKLINPFGVLLVFLIGIRFVLYILYNK
jgi:hypothetical protein